MSSNVLEVMRVDSSNPNGTTTNQMLQAGRTYDVIVSGRFTYGAGAAQADAECTQGANDPNWKHQRWNREDLDLMLNGYEFYWWPVGTEQFCDEKSMYRTTIEATTTTRVKAHIFDSSPQDNVGELSVTIVTRPLVGSLQNLMPLTPSPIETVLVDSRDPIGAFPLRALSPSRKYALVASGEWTWGPGRADADCANSDRSQPHLSPHGSIGLTVNGAHPNWTDVDYPHRGTGCSDSRTYFITGTGSALGGYPLLRMSDGTGYEDNAGVLTVHIYEIS